jgi:hypothetical protein
VGGGEGGVPEGGEAGIAGPALRIGGAVDLELGGGEAAVAGAGEGAEEAGVLARLGAGEGAVRHGSPVLRRSWVCRKTPRHGTIVP